MLLPEAWLYFLHYLFVGALISVLTSGDLWKLLPVFSLLLLMSMKPIQEVYCSTAQYLELLWKEEEMIWNNVAMSFQWQTLVLWQILARSTLKNIGKSLSLIGRTLSLIDGWYIHGQQFIILALLYFMAAVEWVMVLSFFFFSPRTFQIHSNTEFNTALVWHYKSFTRSIGFELASERMPMAYTIIGWLLTEAHLTSYKL